MSELGFYRVQVSEATPEEVPSALGELERAKAELWARLVAAGVAGNGVEPATLLTPGEVAARLRVDRRTVYRLAKKLGGVKVGGSLRFPAERVEKYLSRRG